MTFKYSSKAWIAASILGLCIVAIVYAVFASDWSFSLRSILEIDIENGDGATEINEINRRGGLDA